MTRRTTKGGGIPDWSTVNARIPLTKGSLALMRRFPLHATNMDRIDRDRARALFDRRYAAPDEIRFWRLTELGEAALANEGKVVT